ncbi:MAG: transposase [Thiohalocapsa sp.]|jgi:transposase-like protein|uniref:transposase n=1 Tax=Thiohalocapsa sp. TaxID=2497641 RepID=UPI0025E26B45|nr:transposase [Thiohalocapsa sp.]MCG6940477.1 transposase [Thiohalocapsa sp.]
MHRAEVKLGLVMTVLQEGRRPGTVCRELDVPQSLYYRWLRQFVDHAAARVSGRAPERAALEERIAALRAELDAVEGHIEAELAALTRRRLARWGPLSGKWIAAEVRDQVVEFVNIWVGARAAKTTQLLRWLGISAAKFYNWRRRKGQPNRHNGQVRRKNWVSEQERRHVIEYAYLHPGLGYRRIAQELRHSRNAKLSASSVYRILREVGHG